jgi:hypothetical protein
MSDAIQAPAGDAALAARVQKHGFAAVVSQCVGCGHIRLIDGVAYCNSYASPAAKWVSGMCNFATHAKLERKQEVRSINPLKASKRGGN